MLKWYQLIDLNSGWHTSQKSASSTPHRYITKEELEHALKEQGLYDADKIKEVIADADSDNVRNKLCVNFS
jgi:hypothetical protein